MATIGELVGKEVEKELSRVGKTVKKGKAVRKTVSNIGDKNIAKLEKGFRNNGNIPKKLMSEDSYKVGQLRKEFNSDISYEIAIQLEYEIGKLKKNIPNHEFDTRAAKIEENVNRINSQADIEERARRMAKRLEDEQIAKEIGGNFADIDKGPKIKKDSHSDIANKTSNNILGTLKDKAIPIGVGGGLLFAMTGRSGQMSNAELYGQQTPYNYR